MSLNRTEPYFLPCKLSVDKSIKTLIAGISKYFQCTTIVGLYFLAWEAVQLIMVDLPQTGIIAGIITGVSGLIWNFFNYRRQRNVEERMVFLDGKKLTITIQDN
jgi:hypothetical protein